MNCFVVQSAFIKLTLDSGAYKDFILWYGVLAIIERETNGISLDDVCAKNQVPLTHKNYSIRTIDKSITKGKVEGSVEGCLFILWT